MEDVAQAIYDLISDNLEVANEELKAVKGRNIVEIHGDLPANWNQVEKDVDTILRSMVDLNHPQSFRYTAKVLMYAVLNGTESGAVSQIRDALLRIERGRHVGVN